MVAPYNWVMRKRTSPPPTKQDFYSTLGAGTIVIHRDSVLLVQMNYGNFRGFWTQPGGSVERFEHPAETAARETLEETGAKVRIGGLLGVRHRCYESGQADVFFLFRGEIDGNNFPELSWDSKEIQEAKFWKITDALHSASVRPFTKLAIKMAMEAELGEQGRIALPENYEHDDEVFGASS